MTYKPWGSPKPKPDPSKPRYSSRQKAAFKRKSDKAGLQTGMANVSDTLGNIARAYNLENAFKRYSFVQRWEEIVGEALAEKCSPEEVRGGILFVRVKSSSWAQELSFHKQFILKRLWDLCPESRDVSDIQFRVEGRGI